MSGFSCPACGRPAGEFDSRCSGCETVLPLGSTAVDARSAEDDPLVGSRIPPFRILGRLGQGGMGVVYRAVDEELGREVALKFLAPHLPHLDAEPRDEERFLEEARAAAALDHPGIGSLLQIGRYQGRRFLAMPLYDGETLEARLARQDGSGPLAIDEVLVLASQLAAALAAAHAAGIVHRDLKPGNVLLTRSGQSKLLDFGLARRAGADRLTERGTVLGTPAYMAPEQLRGEEVDARADLWAFGAVLYEALAGRAPFGHGRVQPVQGLVHAILTEDPPPLHRLRPEAPAPLERLVRRCLSRDPAHRPAGADEILAELRAAGLLRGVDGSGATTGGPARSGRPARPRRRRLLAGIAAGAALALLLPLLWLAARQLGWMEPARPLYVVPLAPLLHGPLDAADRSLLEANLQTAVLRTLTALEGVAPIEPALAAGVRGGRGRWRGPWQPRRS
jgi:Protein kinase domain